MALSLPDLLVSQLRLFAAAHSGSSSITTACVTLATQIATDLGISNPCPQCGALGYTDVNGFTYNSTISTDKYVCATCNGQTNTVNAKKAVLNSTGYGQATVTYEDA